jgi:lipopolysaccharide export LptBFGC system permease protein LptF
MRPSRITIHIAKELSVWMLIGLAGSVFIFVSTQMVRLAPLFVGAGGKPLQLVEMLGLLAVPVCGWSLTPAFAVAVFATFARMSRDGETVALDAAGISRTRIASGPLAVILAIALLSTWIWLDAGPRSLRALQLRAAAMLKDNAVTQIRAGQFAHPAPGTTFYADARVDDRTFRGVFFESRFENGRTVQAAAKEARLTTAKGRPAVEVRLKQGTAFIQSGKETTEALGDTALTFETLNLVIPLEEVLRDRLDFLPSTLAVKTEELLKPPTPTMSKPEWRYALWRRVAGPVGTLVFSLLALLLAAGARWRSRGAAVALGGTIFLVYHLVGRFGEGLLGSGHLSAPAAALLPAMLVWVVLLMAAFSSLKQR